MQPAAEHQGVFLPRLFAALNQTFMRALAQAQQAGSLQPLEVSRVTLLVQPMRGTW
jgi:hypothetical protein